MKRFEYALRPKRAGVGDSRLGCDVSSIRIPKSFRRSRPSRSRSTSRRAAASAPGDLVGSVARLCHVGDQVAGAGDFSEHHRSVGTARSNVSSVLALAGMTAGLWCGVACLIAVSRCIAANRGTWSGSDGGTRRRQAERKLADAREALAAGRSTVTLCVPFDRPSSD